MTRLVFQLVALFLAASQSTAFACSASGAIPSDSEHFARAAAVFVAYVTKTEVSPNSSLEQIQPQVIGGTVNVIEVLKGAPPSNNKIRLILLDPTDCAFVVLPGLDYLFFVDNTGFVRAMAGSRPLPTEPERSQLLRQLRHLKQTSSQ